jgi:site-specific DNA recombinase
MRLARAPVHRPDVCAVYTRQSVRTESNLTSCQVQRELCADFAIGKAFLVVDEQFDDEAYSGASLDRPALQELLIQVRGGQIHAVAVQRLDRLSRRVSQCAGILDEFHRAGIEVLIAELPEYANGGSGSLLTNLLSSFAEFERDMTTSRIADTRAGLVARGRRIAGRIPFGYSTDPKTKHLVPVPREAGIVKTMFELVADGVKTSVVEEAALLRKWRTRSGKPWTARQILDTVGNPVYIGRFRTPQGRGLASTPR